MNMLPEGLHDEKETLEEVLNRLSKAIESMSAYQKLIYDTINKGNKEEQHFSKESDSERARFYNWIKKDFNSQQTKMMDTLLSQYEKMDKYMALNNKIIETMKKDEDVMISFVKELQKKEHVEARQGNAIEFVKSRRENQDKNFLKNMFGWAAEQIPLLGMLTNTSRDAPGSSNQQTIENDRRLKSEYEAKDERYKNNTFSKFALGNEEGQRHIDMMQGREDLDIYQANLAKEHMKNGPKDRKNSGTGSGGASAGVEGTLSSPLSLKKPGAKVMLSDLQKLPSAWSAGAIYIGQKIEALAEILSDTSEAAGQIGGTGDQKAGGGGDSGGTDAVGLITGGAIALGALAFKGIQTVIDNPNLAYGEYGEGGTARDWKLDGPEYKARQAKRFLEGPPTIDGKNDSDETRAARAAYAYKFQDVFKLYQEIAAKDPKRDYGKVKDEASLAIAQRSGYIQKIQSISKEDLGNLDNTLFWAGKNLANSEGKSYGDTVESLAKLKNTYKFHQGGRVPAGVVPGDRGDEVNVTLQGGEMVTDKNSVSSDFNKLNVGIQTMIGQFNQLIDELKRNTDITDKKELKVETPSSFPTANKQPIMVS